MKRLKELREAFGFTLAEFAQRAWIEKSELAKLERSDEYPSLVTLRHIAVGFGGGVANLIMFSEGATRFQTIYPAGSKPMAKTVDPFWGYLHLENLGEPKGYPIGVEAKERISDAVQGGFAAVQIETLSNHLLMLHLDKCGDFQLVAHDPEYGDELLDQLCGAEPIKRLGHEAYLMGRILDYEIPGHSAMAPSDVMAAISQIGPEVAEGFSQVLIERAGRGAEGPGIDDITTVWDTTGHCDELVFLDSKSLMRACEDLVSNERSHIVLSLADGAAHKYLQTSQLSALIAPLWGVVPVILSDNLAAFIQYAGIAASEEKELRAQEYENAVHFSDFMEQLDGIANKLREQRRKPPAG